MSTTFSFMIHNENLVRLSELYLTMKENIIYSNKKSYLDNPTLMATRDLIILKLTGVLREMYLDVYGGDNAESCTLDVTSYSEWYYLCRRAVELDLEDFFATYTYTSFYSNDDKHEEEIQADTEEAKDFYSEFLKSQYFAEQLAELDKKRKKK